MNTTYMYFFTRAADSGQPVDFFTLLRQHLPRTCPKEFHLTEDEPVPFTEDKLDIFIRFWWHGMFFWKCKRPEIYGYLFLGTHHVHTGILHLFDTRLAADSACSGCLIALSHALHADYAFAHVLGDPPFSPEDKEINGATAANLQLSLPPVPWAACYGEPYVELFGKESLLALPVQDSREVGPDLVYCQLTSRLLDAVENRELIQERREAVYQRLGRDAFCDPQNPDRQGRVPAFPKPLVVRPERKE